MLKVEGKLINDQHRLDGQVSYEFRPPYWIATFTSNADALGGLVLSLVKLEDKVTDRVEAVELAGRRGFARN